MLKPASHPRIIEDRLIRDQLRAEDEGLAYGAFTPQDAELLEIVAHSNSLPHRSTESLLVHPDRDVRAAVALAVLSALTHDGSEFDAECYGGTWKTAVADLSFPLGSELGFGARDLFQRLAIAAPDEFEEIFLKAAKGVGSDPDFLWSDFSKAAPGLPRPTERAYGKSWRTTRERLHF